MVELLAVIAVITILAGILVPTLGTARIAALKAKTRVQFSQWAAAMEQYRQEYGCYPEVGTDGKLATPADAVKFVRTLSGADPDGSAVSDVADLNGIPGDTTQGGEGLSANARRVQREAVREHQRDRQHGRADEQPS